ncbi:UNVERIFIED_CONTAM: hypothetical protein FKN15_013214 [Acipenser sinensis]
MLLIHMTVIDVSLSRWGVEVTDRLVYIAGMDDVTDRLVYISGMDDVTDRLVYIAGMGDG